MTTPVKLHDLLPRSRTFDTREDWIANRVHSLGASEIAGALGLSSYKGNTPFSVWQRKVDPANAEPLQGEWLDWGHRLEPVILEAYLDRMIEREGEGLSLWTPRDPAKPVQYVHPAFPIITGTPDGLLCDTTGSDIEVMRGVDAKNLGRHRLTEFGEEYTDDIPLDYVVQGTVYCEVFGLEAWDFAVLFGGSALRVYTVEHNPDVAAEMLGKALSWWHDHVAPSPPLAPDLDSSEAAAEFVRSLHPSSQHKELLPATPETVQLAQASYAARQLATDAEERQRLADTMLKEHIGDHAGIAGLATWTNNKDSTKTDWKKAANLLAEHVSAETVSQIIDSCTSTKPGARVFRLKYKPDQES